MNYEIVNRKEKVVVGITTSTSNEDPKMSEKIGNLWGIFYQEGISAEIKNKVNEFSIGLYSDYCPDGYLVTVGNEVATSENDTLTTKVIPAGRYAKFSVHGHMQSAVAAAWAEIWNTELDRSYTGDFEEYLNEDLENADIDIYIALK